MKQPKVLVTGATGKTRHSRRFPTSRARLARARAVVRSYDNRSDRLARLGAEVVQADLHDYDSMRAAVHGTSRAYFCPPLQPHMVQSAVVFALAAREERLESIVGPLPMARESVTSPRSRRASTGSPDRLFELLPDTALTIVNPGLFADLPLHGADEVCRRCSACTRCRPDGHSKNAPPSTDDIARVAVAALLSIPALHAGKTYRPTGPALLSLHEMVAIIGDVVGAKGSVTFACRCGCSTRRPGSTATIHIRFFGCATTSTNSTPVRLR